MHNVNTLIIGGGITGLSAAAFLKGDYLILEASSELGGYCKTTMSGDFVWDHSGHFFHFKDPSIKEWMMENIETEIVEVEKITDIKYKDSIIDFPFQYNVYQLPEEEFLDCVKDAYLASAQETNYSSFKAMIQTTVGKAICNKFLIPYNEKLYACDLNELDANAMGRFFPTNINPSELLERNHDTARTSSYNNTFIYPVNGSQEFVNSVIKRLDPTKIKTNAKVISIDVVKKTVQTTIGEFSFKNLISTLPYPVLQDMMGLDSSNLSFNKVAVFNLGFDKGTDIKTHWRYFPGSEIFYRVGFYNNILGTDKMSLYVEIGAKSNQVLSSKDELLEIVIKDLKSSGIITDQTLVDHQYLEMSPAYVHITEQSTKSYSDWCETHNQMGIYSIGRYGAWTYCSIEDNIIEAKNTAEKIV
jgi:protoporphyrinogen oxidase